MAARKKSSRSNAGSDDHFTSAAGNCRSNSRDHVMPRRCRSAAAIVTHRQAGGTSCRAASVGSGIVNKRIFVLVGLIAVGAAASANAQTGSYDAPPYGRGNVWPYGGPLVPAYDVATIVRSIGLEPLAPPIRRLTTYVMWATDQAGLRVRVIVDARYGEVLAVRPAVAWRRTPAGNRYSGSYNRRYNPAPDRPSYRATPRVGRCHAAASHSPHPCRDRGPRVQVVRCLRQLRLSQSRCR